MHFLLIFCDKVIDNQLNKHPPKFQEFFSNFSYNSRNFYLIFINIDDISIFPFKFPNFLIIKISKTIDILDLNIGDIS